ncbi:MAG TPA: alpha-mannosidase [Clostridiales bacterium]|nr:alpha-mannosidase [Clostridiales bacterium]
MPYPYKEYLSLINRKHKEIESRIYEVIGELNAVAWITPEPVPYKDRTSGTRKEIKIGEKWGDIWDCAWFHFTGIVPPMAFGKKVVLLIDLNGEGCIFDDQGCPVQGLTNVSSTFDYSLGRPGKRVVELADKSSGNELIDIWVDAGCNDLFGSYKGNGELKEAYIAVCREEVKNLYYDYTMLLELMQILPKESARTHCIGYALKEAALLLNDFSDAEISEARRILSKEIGKRGGDPSLTITAIGHAHIDLAWLWPIRETKRKAARTFSTALKMMDKYPDYIFGASQPQLYQWVKEDYPLLYEKVRKRIAEGRWECQGGMWVEADTNISGGEALIRQFLYGKRFFKTEFQKDMEILWLPDVFGYSGALPQIMKKSGCKYFMTIKLSWNEVNQIPHHTFIWEGIDGTRVLAHMPPEGTYNSSAAPRAIKKTEEAFLDKGVSEDCLLVYGIGDGGGGPGEEHLEMLKREKNQAGLAPVQQAPAIDFFRKIDKDTDRYAKWVGELYLEKHQGTYTTQAKNKYYNRKLEYALRDLEIILSMNRWLGCGEYPQERINDIWKEVLLYQFHDILPGSSIKRVYDETTSRYEALMKEVSALTDAAINEHLDMDPAAQQKGLLLVNTLSWHRKQWFKTTDGWVRLSAPPMSITLAEPEHQEKFMENRGLLAENDLLENDLVRVEFNSNGHIISFYDKECDRDIVPKGLTSNVFAVYHDEGDDWDFSALYCERPVEYFKLQSSEAFLDGPFCILRQVYQYNKSQITQEISLQYGSKQLMFKTSILWNESGKMLKVLFPVNIHAAEATCDIQFGSIRRPVHTNTSWDMARFEICAHKWIDLSQPDYGVAVLNDCKYGHRVMNNTIELNLLRSTSYPGLDADKGIHSVTYALYPHNGNHVDGQVKRAGYELNIPMRILPVDYRLKSALSGGSFLSADKENIIIEAVKKAEDSRDLIVRLYESDGMNCNAALLLPSGVKTAALVDMMENHIRDIPINENSLELYFGPFEIHTVKLVLSQ